MDTAITADVKTFSQVHQESVSASFWTETWPNWNFNRPIITPVLLLVGVLLGACAAGFGAWNSTLQLFMVVAPAMAVLALTLAVVPMRWIAAAFGISLLMDALVMLM